MRRIEPTIGDTNLNVDPATAAEAQALAKSRRIRKEMQNWLVSALIFGAMIVGGFWLASRDLVPEQFKLGTPLLFQRLLIVVGLFVIFFSQLVGTALLFRRSFREGGLSLFVPGYVFFALKRNALYVPVVGAMCMGLFAVTVGTLLLM